MTKGERIKARREELGITQVALADMIGESKQTVYKYESGLVSNIPSDKVELIAKALGVQPEWIMGWDVSSSPILHSAAENIQSSARWAHCLRYADHG